eukprot:12495892-Prorocentrum_lima.AAC.1
MGRGGCGTSGAGLHLATDHDSQGGPAISPATKPSRIRPFQKACAPASNKSPSGPNVISTLRTTM